ncbi:flavodoxin family protein [Clostridium folliculivorans]|uniref:Flavodoxin n=1 Tax=Clostridium folliculivorans TaxID=2886038 RepID=A0A9W5Y2W4_9CLOT|nr:flavodoxin family protein [Clostridium folliculivorans]GKU25746.1 flavodoxin [Clostridium folliculivorans]GKU28768.1 flavodoxin [Clostridium folliculivorans]
MKVIALNGSPRKTKNTATVLKEALEGAKTQGAEVELINLYDLNYKGCISCFACKRICGQSYGKCAVKDDLQPVLRKIEEADALILGSPIYLGEVTGEMRSFLERFLFQYLAYDTDHSFHFNKKLPIGLIYTMNVPSQHMSAVGYESKFKNTEDMMKRFFGEAESLFVNDTYQFDDYSKYVSTMFDVDHKIKVRDEDFPKDLKKAFELGIRLVQQTL